MELFLFIILFVIIIALASVGLFTGNFWLILLACILGIVLGALIFSDGIVSEKIERFDVNDNNVTPIYSTYEQDDMTIFSLGWLLLGGGFVLLVISMYYAFVNKPPEMVE